MEARGSQDGIPLVHLAHAWILENKRAALGAPDVRHCVRKGCTTLGGRSLSTWACRPIRFRWPVRETLRTKPTMRRARTSPCDCATWPGALGGRRCALDVLTVVRDSALNGMRWERKRLKTRSVDSLPSRTALDRLHAAHLRRYFHEALPTAPIAQEMLDLVAELYRAEHAADEQGLVGTSNLDFRKRRASPIRARMRAWLDAQRERHPPKSPIAAAIRYNQWEGARRLSRRRARAARQQRLGTCAPPRGPRSQELPLRARRRARSEHCRPVLARGDVRGA